MTPYSVIPAKAGIHFDLEVHGKSKKWVPAFAGMTMERRAA